MSSKSAYQNDYMRMNEYDWSNDAENAALQTLKYILKYIQIENGYLKL